MRTSVMKLVSFDASDDEAANSFLSLEATETYGLRRFPSPLQYHEHVTNLRARESSPPLARLVALAQRDWHVRGQTGCMFARLAARSAGHLRWDSLVIDSVAVLADPRMSTQIDASLRSTADKRAEVVSLLFPSVRGPFDAVRAIRLLVRHCAFWLERDEVADGLLRLHLRYPINETGVQAWVMAFAPFDFVPNTRRGPYFELAIRVKEKPPNIFHRLNQDRDVAHLADVSLSMSEKHWEDRWQSTLRRTRMILGGEPDDVSAAKATLTVPVGMLEV